MLYSQLMIKSLAPAHAPFVPKPQRTLRAKEAWGRGKGSWSCDVSARL